MLVGAALDEAEVAGQCCCREPMYSRQAALSVEDDLGSVPEFLVLCRCRQPEHSRSSEALPGCDHLDASCAHRHFLDSSTQLRHCRIHDPRTLIFDARIFRNRIASSSTRDPSEHCTWRSRSSAFTFLSPSKVRRRNHHTPHLSLDSTTDTVQ